MRVSVFRISLLLLLIVHVHQRLKMILLLIIFSILAYSKGIDAAADVKSFACDFYSDGSNVCYNGFRDTVPGDEMHSKRLHGFNLVGEGEAVNGTWTINDGFFSALDATPNSRKYIGTCKFGTTWTCTGLTTSHDKQGSFVSAVGGGIFSGDSYTGRPGGPIKVAAKSSGFPTALAAD